MHALGQTRSTHQPDHLLHTPDAFVRAPLPGIERGTAIVHIAPAGGAAFSLCTVELEPGGVLAPGTHQRLLFVLEGTAELAGTTSFHTLAPGGYAYLPAGSAHTLTAREATRIALFEKPFHPLAGTPAPGMLVGDETSLPSSPLMGDPDLQVRHLLPDHPAFDFAVNTMTYQPGAALSQVEVHVMEHGLIMLQGGGVYRLGDRWYSVGTGDVIWMAAFCPQWFGAIGRHPAKYLIYKDANRPPL